MTGSGIHIYYVNPTGGGTDGSLASEGTLASPVIIGPLVVANNEESSPVKLAVRCDEGYQATSVGLSLVGTGSAYWALAPDNAGVPGTFEAYGAPLALPGTLGATNTVFWAKAKVASTETLTTDKSVKFRITADVRGVA